MPKFFFCTVTILQSASAHVLILQSIFSYIVISIAVGAYVMLGFSVVHAEEQRATNDSSNTPLYTELFINSDLQNRTVAEASSSVSVIREQDIEERGLSRVEQVLDLIPNIQTAGGSNRPRFFQIRGIGELERYEGAPNASIGFLVDDFDLTGLGSTGALFDIEQVEVLRGPQSTRYGTSGLAGLIRLQSIAPGVKPEVHSQLSMGTDSLLSGGIAFGGPVPATEEKLLFRASVFRSSQDGFRDNNFLGRNDTNEVDESVGRLALTYKPHSDLDVTLRLLSLEQDNGYDVFTIRNGFDTQSDRPGRDEVSTKGLSLSWNYTFASDIVLSSITQFSHTDSHYSYDGDWGNATLWEPYNPYDYFSKTSRDRKNIGQELRLSSHKKSTDIDALPDSFRWTLGLYGFRIEEETNIIDLFEESPFRDLESDYRSNSAAIFSEVEFPLAQKTSLSLGMRIENQDLRYSDNAQSRFSPSDNLFGGHITLKQALSDEVLSYVSLSQGFKGGGFNAGTRIPEGRRDYNPEYLKNLELGVKGDFLNGQLSTALAAFYGWRRDQQVRLALQVDPTDPLSFNYIADNAARSINYGFEAEGVYRFPFHLDWFFAGGLLATEFRDVPDELGYLLGREAAHAPSWQYATGLRYRPTTNTFIRIDYSGKDSFYFDDSHNERSASYGILGASAGYQSSQFALTIWARNLLDKNYVTRGFFFGNEPPDFPEKRYVQLGDPRQVGITAEVYF